MKQGFWECNINRLHAVVTAQSRLKLQHITYIYIPYTGKRSCLNTLLRWMIMFTYFVEMDN